MPHYAEYVPIGDVAKECAVQCNNLELGIQLLRLWLPVVERCGFRFVRADTPPIGREQEQ